MLLNTTVHILMYYYYARKTLGGDVWWKRYLTQLQITQFAINICVGGGKEMVILSLILVWFIWNNTYNCSGDTYSVGLTLIANVTFMLMFVQMYNRNHATEQLKSTDGTKTKSA
jgi:hypothetical protein